MTSLSLFSPTFGTGTVADAQGVECKTHNNEVMSLAGRERSVWSPRRLSTGEVGAAYGHG